VDILLVVIIGYSIGAYIFYWCLSVTLLLMDIILVFINGYW
jgi:hypothetical protein